MKTLIFLLGMFLSSCATTQNYPTQPAMINGPTVTDTSVHVHWYKNLDEIAKVCPDKGAIVYACATWDTYGKVTVCDINTVMPTDFNDIFWLVTLGHEFFHCLGAQHYG